MESLNQKQVDKIFDKVVSNGITLYDLQTDLVDHICCMVESKLENGKSFTDALNETLKEFDINNIQHIQEATIYLLNSKSRKMKKATSLLAILTALSVLVGIFFKLNHFPGANALFIIGVIGCSLFVFPAMAILELESMKNNLQKATIVTGYLSAVLLSLATLFKFMIWPGFSSFYYVGIGLLVFVFIPLFTIKNYKTTENKLFAIAKSLLIVTGITVAWASYRMIDLSLG